MARMFGGTGTVEFGRARAGLVALVLFVVVASAGFRASAADVRVEFDPTGDKGERWAEDLLSRSGIVADTAEFLGREFRLPTPLTIRLGGRNGPLFDGAGIIEIPYGFLVEIRDRFAEGGYLETPEELDQVTLDVFQHTLLHEAGHYLVQALDLPITGKEEDAVDELAYLLLIEMYEDGGDMALSAADAFWAQDAEAGGLVESDFWDEHSLDIQRFHAGVCLIYGSDPERYRPLARELDLPPDRLDLCEDDFQRRRDGWSRLLSPHLTPDSVLAPPE